MFDRIPQLQGQLERQVQNRTGRRIRDLAIRLDRERIVLHGRASTYYLKQLAQECVRGTVHGRTLRNRLRCRRDRDGRHRDGRLRGRRLRSRGLRSRAACCRRTLVRRPHRNWARP